MTLPGTAACFEDDYKKLRALAARYRFVCSDSHTVSSTALAHEVWLRLLGDSREYADRGHFLSTAATAMRQYVVDYVRSRNRTKRGGDLVRVTIDPDEMADEKNSVDVLAVEEALKRLEQWDPRQAKIVELRFFVGLSIEETAEALQLSERTVKRDWAMARAWLQQELAAGRPA